MEQFAMRETRELINGGWFPVGFSSRVVEPEKLRCALEAASSTDSYLNEHPWNFIIATKDDSIEYERLVSCLAEVNAQWARRAPVLMLSVVRLYASSNGERNVHAFRDARHALSNLVFRARAMGLAVQQIPGFDVSKAREQFRIPKGFAATTGIALGYPLDSKDASIVRNERTVTDGRALETFVFTGSWGQPSPLINQTFEKSPPESGCNARRYSAAI